MSAQIIPFPCPAVNSEYEDDLELARRIDELTARLVAEGFGAGRNGVQVHPMTPRQFRRSDDPLPPKLPIFPYKPPANSPPRRKPNRPSGG
jgi:hypothetical protein